MTAVKMVLVRRGGMMRHLEPTSDADVPMFAGMIRATHGGTGERWAALRVVKRGGKPTAEQLNGKAGETMRVGVIGSGLAGLAAACTLAARGHEVDGV